MKNPSNIAHPLKNRTGTSQRNRVMNALGADSALIDGKTMADRLFLISEYARQVNFYQYKKTEIEGESQELDSWSIFFKDSLPFQLAILSKTSIDELDAQFLLLYEELKANPSKQSLESLFNFIFNKIISPITQLFRRVENEDNSFTDSLLAIIKTSFSEAVKSYISLYNSSANFLCINKKNFSDFMNAPWQLKVDEIYALDLCIKYVQNGKKEAFLKAGDILNTIFRQVLSGLQDIVIVSPNYIDESLLPLKESLQKKHQPHIALIFTFLEVFKHFQGNINELSKEHLDFFYEKVLKLVSKNAIPDQAHIVFELANHKKQYVLKKDLLLKDGKDGNNQDIQFGLDHEIVIDKAQVKELRTLSLYPIKAYDTKYIEGVYIAPKANSADGIDKEFKEDQPANWPTLGDKYSKYIKEGKKEDEENLKITKGSKCKDGAKDKPEEHPKARLGFALSSPVLFLKEGRREIDIKLDCEFEIKDNESEVSVMREMKKVIDCLSEENEREVIVFKESIFKFRFSGEEEWLEPLPDNITVVPNLTGKNISFDINILLEDDFPAIVFYNPEKLKEKIDVKNPFPLVKIELDGDIKINCTFDNPFGNRQCCLQDKEEPQTTLDFSSYHFLQRLILEDAKIDVEVCGVKNLIIQNDDNLLDVNSPMALFGPRPKVGENLFVDGGANFYIGSKEIFCKNWQKFWINTQWKDKPLNLKAHYKFYDDDTPFEDASTEINNNSFKFRTSILEDGIWKSDLQDANDSESYKLFELFDSHNTADNNCDSFIKNEATFCYGTLKPFLPNLSYAPKSMANEPLQPLTINTRKGFARLTLAGVSFQHDRYAFVLARQMMALSGSLDPVSVDRVQKDLVLSEKLIDEAKSKIATIIVQLDFLIIDLDQGRGHATTIRTAAVNLRSDLIFIQNNFFSNPNNAKSRLDNDAFPKIDNILTTIGNLINPNANTLFHELDHLVQHSTEIDDLIKDASGTAVISDDDIENNIGDFGLQRILHELERRVENIIKNLKIDAEIGIPKEPYTPLINALSIDYHAIATKEDIDIIHLYPFKDTSKYEDIVAQPTLFPYFDDEGTLFVGLEKITVGGSLSILFQLAEATADSELNRAEINWCYLSRNEWKPLEYDFKVISDTTDGFTVSGITTIIIPEDINNEGNTVMPDPFYWIKVAAPENVKAVAETIGIHTQAAKTSARFTELNDKNRLEKALEEGSIAKLVEADFNVKKVEQLYPSFGGRTPEANGHFYTRVSEHLRHKGRTLMLNDYEKIVLEGFPEIYKAKCITHTMGLSAIEYRRDLEVAPGYVVVTVIPDLTKLKSGNLQEPKVPVSLLEKIGDYIRKRTSPFARLKVMNPRFESVDVSIIIRLYRGKSPDFYKTKLKEDITFFLAPWSLGDSEKLAFGQVVLFSDIVGFVEQLDYVDFVVCLDLEGECDQKGSIIKPLTARSVLTAGEICVTIDREKCNDDEQECPDDESTSNPDINKLYQSM